MREPDRYDVYSLVIRAEKHVADDGNKLRARVHRHIRADYLQSREGKKW